MQCWGESWCSWPKLKNWSDFNAVGLRTVLEYLAHLRLTTNLLPLMTSSHSPRVISVLIAGWEKLILVPGVKGYRTHYAISRSPAGLGMMTNLAFEELAQKHPAVSFIHASPGLVRTQIVGNILKSAPRV